ncbi:hypothetical protein K7X08_023237 [Anisodus acutangulus]|uniref:Uncharacterized protein n=1 Tax=Anisodus acutangulus TaxID=402998 RepID=A0A9Q1R2H2_9SOLA|nr:hypothetical protein K7X08_023237 [Anisodus acutangulus]
MLGSFLGEQQVQKEEGTTTKNGISEHFNGGGKVIGIWISISIVQMEFLWRPEGIVLDSASFLVLRTQVL